MFNLIRHRSIPKLIHYVWVGGRPLPKQTVAYLKSWQTTNPSYQIIRWDESNIDFSHPYLQQAQRLNKWANISNYVRLKAVYDHGGIYLDTDVKLLTSLDSTLQHSCFFEFCVKEEYFDWVNNAIMGAVPHHWFIKKCLKEITNSFDGSEAANLSSPTLITRLLKKIGLRHYCDQGLMIKDIFVYPLETFNPFNWKQKYSAKYITPATIAIHLWEKRWE